MYKDLLMDTATEELAQGEMLATMIARLLDNAPLELKVYDCQREPACRFQS